VCVGNHSAWFRYGLGCMLDGIAAAIGRLRDRQ
jgi:hypothetical protein